MRHGIRSIVPTCADDPHFKSVHGMLDDPDFQQLLFKTTACLRSEYSSCYAASHAYYPITHRGVDAMVKRFINEVRRFLSSALALLALAPCHDVSNMHQCISASSYPRHVHVVNQLGHAFICAGTAGSAPSCFAADRQHHQR